MNQAQSVITTNELNAQPAAAYLAGLGSDVSRNVMRSQLNKIARLMGAADWQQVDWSTLNAANVMAIMAKVTGAPKTRNLALTALRGVAKTAWRLGLMDPDTLAKIEDVHGDTGSREITGREIEPWEIAALMRACADDPTPAGARDAAIFALAHKTGARRAELTTITLDAITKTADGYEIKVIGKRNKQRTLFVDNGSANALTDWLYVYLSPTGERAILASLEAHFTVSRNDGKPMYLFPHISQRGAASGRKMSTTALHKILAKRAAEAGLSNITWHDFRRTFASTLLDAGADISVVAGMMGHESVNTTARYDRRPAEAKRKAARKISTPYFGRSGKAK